MAEPTLSAVFGSGATQDSASVTFSKTDLATVGLTASSTNTAEAILAAIVLKAKNYLTQSNFDANLDQSILIEPGFNSIVTRTDASGNSTEHRQFQYNINLHKLDTSVVDPDDF